MYLIFFTNYVDNARNCPLDLELYYKGDVSKLRLAELLIIKAKSRHPQLKHIAFDSWYCQKSVIETAETQGLYFYSQLRQDRRVVYRKRPMAASRLSLTLPLPHRSLPVRFTILKKSTLMT